MVVGRRTWVTPLRSMRKRLMLQLPLLMELSMPWLIISARRFLPASKAEALLAFDRVVSACTSMRICGKGGRGMYQTRQAVSDGLSCRALPVLNAGALFAFSGLVSASKKGGGCSVKRSSACRDVTVC